MTGCDPYGVADGILKGIKFYKDDLFAIPSNLYDIVTMIHTLEHLENPKEVIRRINTLLSKNGKLIIEIPVINSWL